MSKHSKLCCLASFFIPFFLITNYNLNHWYVFGAYMLDSGWFSFLASHASFPSMANPPSIGGTYLETHFSPIFWILSFIKSFIESLPDNVFFAMLQGLWVGIISICIFFLSKKITNSNLISLIASLAGAFNGIVLAIIGFPHFEIAIPAFLILTLTLLSIEKRCYACICLSIFLLLVIREDAGLHAFGLFILISVYFKIKNNKAEAIKYLTLAVVCAAYSLTAILFQKYFFSKGDNALARVYFGSPIYGHIGVEFIKDRLSFYIANRQYILLPVLISLVYAVRNKNLLLCIGTLSVMPWLLFSISAFSLPAGALVSYYSFPIMIALLWPTISTHIQKQSDKRNVYLQIIICTFSIFLLIGSQGLHDNNPFKKMGFNYAYVLLKTDRTISSINHDLQKFGNVVVDDSIASFLTKSIKGGQWKYYGNFTDSDLAMVDTIFFFKDSWLSDTFEKIILKANLNNLYEVPGTKILCASKNDLKKEGLNFSYLKLFCHQTDQKNKGY
ncbi:hypothetical protein C4565_04355 [Candidatus Parcubacteria bacterium]|nr:MAG: hypothetical protein C4565_04355 [Candidatus Parcubacteria bacterium]